MPHSNESPLGHDSWIAHFEYEMKHNPQFAAFIKHMIPSADGKATKYDGVEAEDISDPKFVKRPNVETYSFLTNAPTLKAPAQRPSRPFLPPDLTVQAKASILNAMIKMNRAAKTPAEAAENSAKLKKLFEWQPEPKSATFQEVLDILTYQMGLSEYAGPPSLGAGRPPTAPVQSKMKPPPPIPHVQSEEFRAHEGFLSHAGKPMAPHVKQIAAMPHGPERTFAVKVAADHLEEMGHPDAERFRKYADDLYSRQPNQRKA